AAPLLLRVDGDLALAVDLGQVEVLAVEDDLRVVVGEPPVADGDVVAPGPADRGDLLVDREDLWAPLGLDPLQGRHGREHTAGRPAAPECGPGNAAGLAAVARVRREAT